jgi:hypothetical protein
MLITSATGIKSHRNDKHVKAHEGENDPPPEAGFARREAHERRSVKKKAHGGNMVSPVKEPKHGVLGSVGPVALGGELAVP